MKFARSSIDIRAPLRLPDNMTFQLPELLYDRVVEVSERLDAEGEIIKSLNENEVRTALKKAKIDGINSVAIAFMHSYINPNHENIITEFAHEEK